MKTKVAEFGQLEEGKSLCVKEGQVKLVLIKQGGAVFALENKCPHLNLPLGKGKIENGQIVCPFHGSRFDIQTGENKDWVAAVVGIPLPGWSRGLVAMGKKPAPVKTFPVSVENGDVMVDLA